MSFSFTMPWARGRADSATAQSSLDTGSVFELEPAPKKLPSLACPSAPVLLPDNGFSFPHTSLPSPSILFPFKNAHHTGSSDDSLPVSNSSASISEGFATSGDEDGVALAAPRPAVPRRLEASALVAALDQHSPQLMAALVILGYQGLWPSEHAAHRCADGTVAGVLALARRAGAQAHELTPDFLRALLWLLHALDTQVGSYASDVARSFTALLLPREERAAAREALQRALLDLQGPLLERCGWRVRLAPGAEVGPALAELHRCPGFGPWCAVVTAEVEKLVKKRPHRANAVSNISQTSLEHPDAAALAAAGFPNLKAFIPPIISAHVDPNSTTVPFPGPLLLVAARGEDAARAGGQQPWRKRLRGVDAAEELPNKQAQRPSVASRFHTALRGMFGGGAAAVSGVLLQDPSPGGVEEGFGSEDFVEE